MDGKHFDALVRAWSSRSTRRTVSGGIASGLLMSLLGLLEADDLEAKNAKRHHKHHDHANHQAQAAKKKHKKKKKKKKKHKGGTPPAAPPTPPTSPSPPPPQTGGPCTPNASACDGRACGTVDNGCGVQISCGDCSGTDVCSPSGQCNCQPNASACDGRECGAVDDGCGNQVSCGSGCTDNEQCDNASGECVCRPEDNPCGDRACGSVTDRCGNTVECGSSCAPNEFCNANGRCRPAVCQECAGCCNETGTCEEITTPQLCGHSGSDCETCNPEVACVNGECTCSRTSCASGCCTTDQQGRPKCDNSLRPCGNTCIPKEQCCTGEDSLFYQETTPGCHPNETCVVNGEGFGECVCGSGGRCWFNQGCCTLDGNNQPTCDTSLRPCGDICIAKEQCCVEGQLGCDDGVSCTAEACQQQNGVGVCVETFPDRICPQACAAGKGYGNDVPRDEREVLCGSSGSVNGLACYCWRTMEGDNVCTEDSFGGTPCRRSADCSANEVCIRSGLTTGTNVCAPLCT